MPEKEREKNRIHITNNCKSNMLFIETLGQMVRERQKTVRDDGEKKGE